MKGEAVGSNGVFDQDLALENLGEKWKWLCPVSCIKVHVLVLGVQEPRASRRKQCHSQTPAARDIR